MFPFAIITCTSDLWQKYEDVQVVVLHKEVGSGLGFTLAGGVDQNKPVTVSVTKCCNAQTWLIETDTDG